ncbi:NAD(P) transhydrogenase beta subunit precursor [Sphingobium herbicidovorans NBRC 16415]|uniref:NAD(P) transhydrogenase beta subunit n=1 Tax=Sphingobium herbicidovorans (strain ATCC 700291 / DSM 11019 / CCUG 56400 / KCTC 2939 / LMG 18315 / NBRC 16415 / MH) TaxID=1219045 RepID=A0A086PE32_SPHHM|nr:hypothetical protein [Sphingobium herbicidovorans]KFG91650.1 NAD(P) transhydrogenase beta subunit precursor [Sphingobium herbicidovorans NBRC 16415]
MIDAVTLAWAVAALLFFLSLWPSDGTPARRQRNTAAAGIALLSAAAVYGMDFINMPEIVGALVIGAALGLLMAREWPYHRLFVLMTGFAGLAGSAAICAAAAVWLNPYAFGLIDQGSDGIATRHMVMLVMTMSTGAVACGAAFVALIGRGVSSAALLALAIGMAGWSAAALAFLLQNIGMVAAGGLAGAGGAVLALRLWGRARGRGIADTGRGP